MDAETYTLTNRTPSIRPILRFGLHYGVMVGVMFAGMGLFAGLLAVSGYELSVEAPALFLAGMGASMTAPMIWFMRRRGHSPAANRAMALSMILPTVGVLGLLAASSNTDVHELMGLEHMAMLPAMLVAMLPYRREYTHGHRAALA